MKSKTFGLVLLFFLLAPFTTAFILLKKQQKQIRREVKWKMIAGLDKSELVHFEFSKVEVEQKLNWKHSKEFEYRGEFYDVVEMTETEDSAEYWCWWDHEETQLNQKLNRLFANKLAHHTNHRQKQGCIYFVFKTLFFEENEIKQEDVCMSCTLKNKVFYSKVFDSLDLTPDAPPPICNV